MKIYTQPTITKVEFDSEALMFLGISPGSPGSGGSSTGEHHTQELEYTESDMWGNEE